MNLHQKHEAITRLTHVASGMAAALKQIENQFIELRAGLTVLEREMETEDESESES